MKIVVRLARNPVGTTPDGERGDQPGDGIISEASPCFGGVPPRSRSFPLAMAASLGLHLLGAVLVHEAIRIASLGEVNVMKDLLAKSRVESLLIRIPPRQPLLLPRIQRVAADAAGAQRSKGRKARRASAARSAMPETAPSRATAILLQPNSLSPELAAALDLRSLTVWSGPSPQRTPAPIVAGSAEPVPSTTVAGLTSLAEIPVIAPSNLDVPAPPIRSDRAGLSLPASGSTPLQSEAVPTPPGSATAGEPAAVVAISSLPPVPNEVVVIPPGNYLIVGSDGASTKAESSTAKPPDSAKPESAKLEPAKTVPVNSRTSAEATSAEKTGSPTKQPSASPRVSPMETAKAGRGEPGKAGQSGDPVQASRTIPTASGAIQVRGNNDGSLSLTYPRDGQFDIVIIQSGAPEAAGDLSKLLSGKPVHTVYIQVGGPKEWILQYCLPEGSRADARQSGMVVSLGAPAPLRAPFVLEAHLPPGVTWHSKIHQVFHGILGPNGKLEQLRAVTANSSPGQLMEYLARWTFRPATSGKETKLVEVLLIIPPDPAA